MDKITEPKLHPLGSLTFTGLDILMKLGAFFFLIWLLNNVSDISELFYLAIF